MSSSIRICPNCGAGVVGKTTTCPRCDYLLPPEPLSEEDAIPAESTAPAETPESLLEPQVPDSDIESLESLADAVHEVLRGRPETQPEVVNAARADAYETTESDIDTAEEITPQAEESGSDESNSVEATSPHSAFENAATAPLDPKYIGASVEPDDTQESVIAYPAYTPEPDLASIPAAPYTPPPLREATASLAPYSFPSNYFLEQRMEAYRQGGYDLISYSPYQATLAYGKPLGFFWWLLALLSVLGFIWYFIILMASGFSKDRVFLIVERDGTLYEDGPGAAHTRRQRARVGRRWGFLGVIMFFLALMWFIVLVITAVVGINRYRPELEAAYPAVSLFAGDSTPTQTELDSDAISTAKSAVLAVSIMFVLSVVTILTGLSLTIVGYLHSTAYEVRVIPLPDLA